MKQFIQFVLLWVGSLASLAFSLMELDLPTQAVFGIPIGIGGLFIAAGMMASK